MFKKLLIPLFLFLISSIFTTLVGDEAFKLDNKRKAMVFFDKPCFIGFDDGRLGIRVYFGGDFYSDSKIKSYIKIRGVKHFSLTDSKYIDYDERERLHLNEKSETYIDIIGDFRSNQKYKLTFKRGLKDSYQYQLRDDISFDILIGNRKSALHFEDDRPYLSSIGEIGFESVNLDEVNIYIEKIPSINFRYFINFQEGDEEKVYKSSVEVFSKNITLSNTKNEFVKHKFSIKSFTDRYKSGVFRVVMKFGNKSVEKIIYLSDIGISAKISKDQAFISLASLSSTEAIKNAKVEIFSDKNVFLASGKSDKNGICIINKKGLWSKNPKSIVVTTSDDKNFLTLHDSLNEFLISEKNSIENRYKAWIYLQSRLVRPSSKAKILIVLKDKDYESAQNIPVRVDVRSPDYRTIYKKVHKCNSIGAIEIVLDIPREYKTGTYKISVKLGDIVIGSELFLVETFMPQKIKNKIIVNKEIFSKDEPISGTLKSSYLFGAPASQLSVEAKLNAFVKDYTNDNYKGFSFTNLLLAQDNKLNYLDIRKDLKLSNSGEAKFFFDTSIDQKVPSILKAQITMSVFDDGREVSSYKSVDIYPYSSMVGVKVSGKNFERGERLKAQTILIDPLSGEIKKGTLQAVIKKQIWHYFYDARGYYKWEKEVEEIDRFDIEAGESINKIIDANGNYILELHDKDGLHSASQEFFVSGWEYDNIAPTNEIEKVQIEVDDILYQKGDILEASFKSPIMKGRALVTLESDKIYFHRVVSIKQGSASLDIPIDFDIKDGVYLSVSVVRSSDKASVLVPFRAFGSKFIKPDRTEHKINLSIEAPKISHSHDDITISVSCDKNSYILISLVDEGILQIMDQKVPTPFDFFTLTPMQKVAFYDLYNQLMHSKTKGKLLEFGADGGDELLMSQKHLSPENAAKRVKPFLYWSKLIKSDDEGFASVDLKIPAFNGSAKIVAISIDKDNIGASWRDLIVRDDVIVKPTYPRFALVGDKLKVPVRVFNTTSKEFEVALDFNSSDQLSLENLPQNIKVSANSSKVFEVDLYAQNLGKAEVRINAKVCDKIFYHSIELPIYSANSLQTKVFRGETSKRTTIKIPKEYFSKEGTKVKINLSKTYKAQLKGSIDDLISYPYGCAEQTSSKLLALLYLNSFVKNDNSLYSKNLLKDREMFINEGIIKLANLQYDNGDFAYWETYGEVNPYASVYASDILLSLKDSGFGVPSHVIDNIYNALSDIAQHGRDRYSYFDRLYASFLLSSHNKIDQSIINSMYDNSFYKDSDIVGLYMMAYILKNANLDSAFKNIANKIKNFDYLSMKNRNQLGGNFYSKSRNLSFSLFIHLKTFGKDKMAFDLLEKVAKNFKHLYSTQDKAFALRAIGEYYRDNQDDKIDLKLTLNSDAKKITKESTIYEKLISDTIVIDPQGKTLNYTVEVSGYLPLKTDTKNKLFNKRINIQSTFVGESGKKININNFKLGDMIYSKILLKNRDKLENIAVVQRVPSCFEIINERLFSSSRSSNVQNSKNFNPSYQDIRDDRVLTFINLSKNSLTTFFIPVRITTKGECQIPAVFGEAMYDSRIYDYSENANSLIAH